MRILPSPFEELRRDAGVGNATVAWVVLGAFAVPGFLGAAETLAFWRIAGQDHEAWRAFAQELPQWIAFSFLTPLILWLGQRLPVARARWVGPVTAHAALALVLGTVYAATAGAASMAFSPFPSTRGYVQTALSWYLGGLPLMLLTYFAVLGASWAVYYFARHRSGEIAAARLETQLADARLSALRMQLHPHFLFNSLNAVTVLVRDREWEPAERAVHLLAELLRETLRVGGPDRVPLSKELDFTLRYLELERLRFPERLQVRCDVPDECSEALVPVLVLQPLVENALRHGVAPLASAGALAIRARTEDGTLILSVEDDGPGPGSVGRNAGTGVGLRNVRDRLQVLFGADASVALTPREGGGACATVSLPLEIPPRAGGSHA